MLSEAVAVAVAGLEVAGECLSPAFSLEKLRAPASSCKAKKVAPAHLVHEMPLCTLRDFLERLGLSFRKLSGPDMSGTAH